jgi:hypothetical protein
LFSKEVVRLEELRLPNEEVRSFQFFVFFQVSLQKFNNVSNKLTPKPFSSFLGFNNIEICYEVSFKFDYKERCSKLNFKFFVYLVDCPQLLESVVGKTEQVVFLIEFP